MAIFAPKIGRRENRTSEMSSMAAMEQATLGQYFTTRKKGLEGVHPAKRRKVDAVDTESEVAVRRSTRAKRQVASSQTKTSRAHKGVKRRAKESMNEESAESSCQLKTKVVSEPTSLFDDHAFAEALIGKLSDAQRKRKMAFSTQTEDAIVNVSKDTSISVKKGQRNSGELESETKSRRRTARLSKPSKQAAKGDKNTTEQVSSEPTHMPTSAPTLPEAHVPTENKTEPRASPSKTPPVVRRIGAGVKANPWIAEQAKIVLSRGRAAVNLSKQVNIKGTEGQQLTGTKDVNSVKSHKVDEVDTNTSKAQEDLAKARKLIKTMRSLEKSAARSSQSTTVDHGQRLHQVPASSSKNNKQVSHGIKEVPAYERFHTLAHPGPSAEAPVTLSLPFKYKTLSEMFRCTDTVLNLLGQRKEKCTFTKLKDAVQQMSRKRFEKKHLAQMKSVYPSSLEFRQDKCSGKSSSFELIIEFGKTGEAHNKLTLTATELLARRDVFQKNLLKLTKKHHQDFLQNLDPPMSVEDDKIIRWHPKFRVDDLPDIEQADLPQPPVVKMYNSANDVLEKARDMIAPRVERALRTVAKVNEEKKHNMDSNLPENTQIKNSSKKNSALKGISQDLLNKIRQKEAKKIEESMMRDPLVDKKLAMKERLPDLCRILKAYFSTERKAAIPLEDATVKLSESYKTSLSPVQVEEHVRFMSQLVPEWISVLTVRKCAYIKINKSADVNNVINKVMTKEVN